MTSRIPDDTATASKPLSLAVRIPLGPGLRRDERELSGGYEDLATGVNDPQPC
jgi:hypothetical protein